MVLKDPRLIHVVSARYPDMQGLATVADSGFLLIPGTAFYLVSEEWHVAVFALVLAIYMVVWLAWGLRRLKRYYEERFGRTARTRISSHAVTLSVNLGLIGNTCRLVPHASLPIAAGILIPLLVFIPVWISVRDYPVRAYWLVLAVVGALVGIQFAGVNIASSDAYYHWLGSSSVGLGLGLVAVGMLDHYFLARGLSGGADPAGSVEGTSRGLGYGP